MGASGPGAGGDGETVGACVGSSVGDGESVSVGVGVGETVGDPVGDAVGVGDSDEVGDSVGVGDSEGVGLVTGLLGITDGNGCGGGGSEPRRAHSAVTAKPAMVASASHVHTGPSFAGASSVGDCASTGASGSVGSWSAMRPG